VFTLCGQRFTAVCHWDPDEPGTVPVWLMSSAAQWIFAATRLGASRAEAEEEALGRLQEALNALLVERRMRKRG